MRPREISPTVTLFAARTPTLPPATQTNSYAIGSRDVVLVEPATPYDDEQRAWLAWARSLPSAGRVPVAIVLTHHHADHVGGAMVFARELALPVWAHPETASRVDVPIDRRLADRDTIDLDGPRPERWHVMHTPGHAPGHVCLHEPTGGTVIVGDMVASVGTILVAPGDGDMGQYIAQLERLETLGARLALPAHGEPIDDPSALFRRYVVHRRLREAKVLSALTARGVAGGTAEDVLPDAYDDVPPATWPIAMLSLQSHLAKLVDEGAVRAEPLPYGDARYSVAS